MQVQKNWSIKDIKKYLKSLKELDIGFQHALIVEMLNLLELEYIVFNSYNGRKIIEVFEMYFIVETEKRYKLIKIIK